MGLAAWASGDLDTAIQMISDGMANVYQAGYISPAIGDALTLADLQIVQGHLKDAMATYHLGLQWATESCEFILRGAADMYVGMCNILYERNDLKSALQHLNTSTDLGELGGLPQNPYRWCTAMARIREASGDMDGALDLLDKADCLYEGNFSPNVRPISTRKVRLWLAQDRIDDALGWVRRQGLSVDDNLSYLREFDHITLVKVLLARYQSDHDKRSLNDAMKLLDRLLKVADEGGRNGSMIEILVLQALAHHLHDDITAALTPLQYALDLAEPEGYVRIFLDEGPRMKELIGEALKRKHMPVYPQVLLNAYEVKKQQSFDQIDLQRAIPKEQVGSELLEQVLSRREQEILILITQGLSNREIGERLFLALDTIKGHNRKIFDKLHVQSRTEAIARARELGLM